jgi:phosphatidylserine decarboxylase
MGSKASALRHHRHGSSSSDEESTDSSTTTKETTKLESKSSGISKLRKRGGSRGGGSLHRFLKEEQFCGIAKIQLTSAKMEFKDKWFACVSLGEQTFRTVTSVHTNKPEWKSERSMVLENKGPRVVRVSVFETNRTSKNNLVGFCEIDLADIFTSKAEHKDEVHKLYDPNQTSKVVGEITLGYSAETRAETEMHFARRLLTIVDYDANGELSYKEFRDLIKAFGNALTDSQLDELYKHADINKDGKVNADELATLVTQNAVRTFRVKACPVCGEKLGNTDLLNDIIHMSLCFDEGTGNQIMTGGFLTEKQASHGWMFKLSEWASFQSYDVGRANAGHILVWDRKTKRLVEELIDNKIVLSMRAIYQSKMGLALLDIGTKNLLQSISVKQGVRMSSAESKEDIPKFIEFFQDRINIDEFKEPIEHYQTFNQFFIRELKPGVRPIAYENNDAVAVSAADCRLMAFNSVDDATRFWIKGRKFSLAGLLTDKFYEDFKDGSLVIFRLAPQDYHRFHSPVTGKITKLEDIPGHLYTVNPIAVNSKYCNVFTENKRKICIIETKEFGKVAFVAIGATMVGTITFTKNEGDEVKKGDEMGFFSFGGSTVIVVFQKKGISLDEDLLANSERSLETLVYMGNTVGIARGLTYENIDRPTVTDSVAALDSPVAQKGIQATDSINVRFSHLGLPDDDDDDGKVEEAKVEESKVEEAT